MLITILTWVLSLEAISCTDYGFIPTAIIIDVVLVMNKKPEDLFLLFL